MKIRFTREVHASALADPTVPAVPAFSRRFRAREVVTVTEVRQPLSQRRQRPSTIFLAGETRGLDVPPDSYEILSTYKEDAHG